jgi:hypothetical protein
VGTVEGEIQVSKKNSLQKLIFELIAAEPGITAVQVADRLGCRQEYVRVCICRGKLVMKHREPWSAEQIAQLYDLRDNQKLSFNQIGLIMGKTASALNSKYSYAESAVRRHKISTVNIVPRDCDIDRRHRQSLEPRDLTAAFCGDPLPGYSALERRA